MMRILKFAAFFLPVFLLASCLFSPVCQANSAEPPSILIIVPDAPDDLTITIIPENTEAYRRDKATETYFTFYRYALQPGDITLRVTGGGASFETTVSIPPGSYNNVFTLDLKNETLESGKAMSRSVAMVALRVILTLVIEGIIFFLFTYRSRRSWLVFIIVNLCTQGFLNIWLNQSFDPLDSYVILFLILAEVLVFAVEIAAFLVFVREHRRRRTLCYVLAANILSLAAGGYLIMALPV